MTYTFDDSCFSDLFKDVCGFRPTGSCRDEWLLATDDERQAIWDSLIEALEKQLEERRVADQAAMESWRLRIQAIASDFNGSILLGITNL